VPAAVLVREEAFVGEIDERTIAQHSQVVAEAGEGTHVAEAEDAAQPVLVQIRRMGGAAQ
jgi:hypothetical protein